MVLLRSGLTTANSDDTGPHCHIVIGGGGYAGLKLGIGLHNKGQKVILVDVCRPKDTCPEGMEFIKCDIRNYEDVRAALKGADYVYHLASYGMSGREQLKTKLIEQVNITGTQNVIKACWQNNIAHLVYTSTYNVVFGGQKIENGNESLPYLPLDKHPDHYSRTKSIAEKSILQANGSDLENGGKLFTCALRLAGVYGPGEQRHLPRIVSYIQKGLFRFTYGELSSLVEFLHVDNLVQAHIHAGQALSESRDHQAAGQAYFISDCKPVNNFEFFRPLVEGLGYTYPTINVPVTLIYFIAFLTEWIHFIVGRMYNFQPMLTRTEVYKTGVTHYFSNDKAKKELGYSPVVQNDMDSAVKWFLDRGYHRDQKKKSKFIYLLRDLALIVIFVSVIFSCLPMVR